MIQHQCLSAFVSICQHVSAIGQQLSAYVRNYQHARLRCLRDHVQVVGAYPKEDEEDRGRDNDEQLPGRRFRAPNEAMRCQSPLSP